MDRAVLQAPALSLHSSYSPQCILFPSLARPALLVLSHQLRGESCCWRCRVCHRVWDVGGSVTVSAFLQFFDSMTPSEPLGAQLQLSGLKPWPKGHALGREVLLENILHTMCAWNEAGGGAWARPGRGAQAGLRSAVDAPGRGQGTTCPRSAAAVPARRLRSAAPGPGPQREPGGGGAGALPR